MPCVLPCLDLCQFSHHRRHRRPQLLFSYSVGRSAVLVGCRCFAAIAALTRVTSVGGEEGRDRRRLQIADLISKLRAKIMGVVRGATFLINARSNARMAEEENEEGEGVGGASGLMHQFE